jgi:hypothetical protein
MWNIFCSDSILFYAFKSVYMHCVEWVQHLLHATPHIKSLEVYYRSFLTSPSSQTTTTSQGELGVVRLLRSRGVDPYEHVEASLQVRLRYLTKVLSACQLYIYLFEYIDIMLTSKSLSIYSYVIIIVLFYHLVVNLF